MDIKLTAADLGVPVIKKEFKSEVEESKAAAKLIMKQEVFKHEVVDEGEANEEQ